MSDFIEKRRFDRVELESDNELYLHLLNPDSTDHAHTIKAVVSNVSLRGCRLLFSSQTESASLQDGRKYVVSLNVGAFAIPLTVEIIRHEGLCGVAIVFKPPYPKELGLLERFLEPRTLGASLREIGSNHLQKSSDIDLRWFQGINDTHLFSWFDMCSGEVIQQQLVFLAAVVEWQKNVPLRTGRIKSEIPISEGIRGWVPAELLLWDSVVDQHVLERCGWLLKSSSIDSATKNIFLNKLGINPKD